jgi:hypothetical protein
MTCKDLNLLPLLWESTAISTRLSIACFQLTLTMPKQTDDQKKLNRGKMTWNVELSEGAFDPLAMKSRGWEGVGAGNHSATGR